MAAGVRHAYVDAPRQAQGSAVRRLLVSGANKHGFVERLHLDFAWFHPRPDRYLARSSNKPLSGRRWWQFGPSVFLP